MKVNNVSLMRRACIFLLAFGLIIPFLEHDLSSDTVPFPGKGLSVKAAAKIPSEGDYYLAASLPRRADDDFGLLPEKIPCALEVRMARNGTPLGVSKVTAFSRYAEFGWARIQFYKSDPWHLTRGSYALEITSLGECTNASARGATLTLEQSTTQDTERFLARSFVHSLAILCRWAGLVGLMLCELRARTTPQSPLA